MPQLFIDVYCAWGLFPVAQNESTSTLYRRYLVVDYVDPRYVTLRQLCDVVRENAAVRIPRQCIRFESCARSINNNAELWKHIAQPEATVRLQLHPISVASTPEQTN